MPETFRTSRLSTSRASGSYARGNLVEPHTRKTIPLSTLAVRKYVEQKGWQNKYGAVLFCEKEGFQPLFEAVKLGERYDLAVMSSKGTSVTAARTLIDAMIKAGIPVYCIRDFSPGLRFFETPLCR